MKTTSMKKNHYVSPVVTKLGKVSKLTLKTGSSTDSTEIGFI